MVLKVLMVCNYPQSPSDICGGTSAAAYNLVHALLEYTDCSIVTFSLCPGDTIGCRTSGFDGRLTIWRIPFRERYRGLVNYLGQRRQFRRVVAAERPNVIHAQGEGLYASMAVGSKVPHVYTIHGVRLKELRMERNKIGWLRYTLRTRMIRGHHAKARCIIAINAYTRDAISGLHAARIHVIPNVVGGTFFELYARDAPVPGRILMVAGVRRRKDNLCALRVLNGVCARGIPMSLDIVGPEEPDYRAEVDEFIRQKGLGGNVRIHGLVSEHELHELYCRADLLLLTSQEESSPICLVEAMAAGKPIVSSDVGGVAEIIEPGRNALLAAAGDDDALASHVAALVVDRERRRAMS